MEPAWSPDGWIQELGTRERGVGASSPRTLCASAGHPELLPANTRLNEGGHLSASLSSLPVPTMFLLGVGFSRFFVFSTCPLSGAESSLPVSPSDTNSVPCVCWVGGGHTLMRSHPYLPGPGSRAEESTLTWPGPWETAQRKGLLQWAQEDGCHWGRGKNRAGGLRDVRVLRPACCRCQFGAHQADPRETEGDRRDEMRL